MVNQSTSVPPGGTTGGQATQSKPGEGGGGGTSEGTSQRLDRLEMMCESLSAFLGLPADSETGAKY